jgi:hypothetical protein
MTMRREWLLVFMGVGLISCGSPGNSRLVLTLDAGDEASSGDSSVGQAMLDAPPDLSLPNDSMVVDARDSQGADAPDVAANVDASPVAVDTSPSPDGISCQGCWDGTKCQPGTDVATCGSGGGTCKVCNDGNLCTADKCVSGACSTDKLTGPSCPGGVCTAGMCHCGAPGEPCCTTGSACEGSQVCQNGRCGNCGSEGTSCCPGSKCASGNTCNGAMCEACGGANQLCCGGSCNSGFNCGGNGRCSPCGGNGQTCCASGNACQTNLTCGSGNTCQCGAIGQACCGGSACTDDGNACNGSEVCQGTCQHQSPIVCTALDQCHDVGQCQPATGACTNPTKMNGSVCTDGDPCTQNDSCQSGACIPGTQKQCATGQRCVGGTCSCDATSCASGCCANNQCQPGTADSACGASGTCNVCTSTQICQSRSCAACGGLNQPCCHPTNTCNSGFTCSNSSCKIADGSATNCTNSNDCASGNCVVLYPDADNDSFGDKTRAGSQFCGSRTGYVADNTDCCDSDNRVRPNQSDFFPGPRNATCPGAANNFDYNCDGMETPKVTAHGVMCYSDSDPCTPGWVFGPPACGTQSSYTVCLNCFTGQVTNECH